ncbi:MAG: LysR family transcriptional regulator [Solirubrobacterales bacterium]|nr:LysR family transcriptional regulator [Solirubrobacterales bacterium]
MAATAMALHLTPSAVSQQLAGLARDVGVPLLAKQGRGVRLTAEARLLLEHADAVLAQLERARADLRAHHAGEVGTVRVGAFATAVAALVAPALSILRAAHPRLELMIHEIEAPACFSALDNQQLDLVVTVEYRGGPRRNDPRYYRWALLEDPLDVALPAGHHLARPATVDLADLATERWITGTPEHPCTDIALAACAASGFAADVAHQTNDWTAVLALVAAGAGVALVPRLARASNPVEDAISWRPVNGRPARSIYAAVRAGSETTPVLHRTLSALRTAAQAPSP